MIALSAVCKSYDTPAGPFDALRAVDLRVAEGEFVSIVGRSGSGKSTLLNMVSGIDRPTSGSIEVAGASVHSMRGADLAAWRGRTVGVVFQFFQLLPTLTIAENVMLPMDFLGSPVRKQRRARAMELLGLVGVADQADKLPLTVSGGQQQRAAIARALANDPPVITADEPTGNLDSVTAAGVLDLFRRLAERGTTVLVATHERDIPGIDRTIELVDGAVAGIAAGAAR